MFAAPRLFRSAPTEGGLLQPGEKGDLCRRDADDQILFSDLDHRNLFLRAEIGRRQNLDEGLRTPASQFGAEEPFGGIGRQGHDSENKKKRCADFDEVPKGVHGVILC
ncbi:MAG: hypothetical protein MPW14_23995 [Candidatus Manganitrophus sp.]|nr:hypothetical protein [Candidatus Manganitrophus sp.]WDT72424.1 MAG: hypothetical protein MPW17_06200 [Candidatus Manganitrophus sp.]WDT80129.1 MAG: hypothetical protein MPW14_23995 [Candidatus Manganitrophus sp.]